MKIQIKIFLISICLLVITSKVFSQPDNQHQESSIQDLTSGINKLINDPFFEKTLASIDVFDLTDSISIFRKDEKLLLHPASNMKILTSIAGLINLGKDYQFKTQLFHTGVIDEETLFGDLVVIGGFDPDFTTDDLDSLVRVVQSLGIKNIVGGIYADVSKKDSLYWGEGWMWDDDPDPDESYLSALNINDNAIKVFVEGDEIGLPAKVFLIPQTDFVKVVNNTVTVMPGSSDNFIVTRDWVNRSNAILVDGKVKKTSIIDCSANTKKINLLYPEKYFLTLFKEHLEQKGIKIEKPLGIKILEENSVYLTAINRSIDTVLAEVNKTSDNLDAEMLLYAVAFNDSGAPAIADDGLIAVKRYIEMLGFNSDNYYLADGSGVSHYNLVSAELLLEFLKNIYYARKDLFDLFYNSLAVAGVDGTLKNRMRGTLAEGNVHAKTGTIKGVSNLSGYVTAKNGHLIVFSIMIQNFVNEYSTARNFQNKICELLAEYE